jgi:uncharacterized membrane protein
MDGNNSKKTSLGMEENVEGLLCYALSWVSGLVFLLIEKDSKFVKFHAMQSLITFLGLMVFGYIIRFIPFIGGLVSILMWPLQLVLWIILMVKAYNKEMFKLPVIGDFVEQQINK